MRILNSAALFLVILVVSMDRNKSAKIKETADSEFNEIEVEALPEPIEIEVQQ